MEAIFGQHPSKGAPSIKMPPKKNTTQKIYRQKYLASWKKYTVPLPHEVTLNEGVAGGSDSNGDQPPPPAPVGPELGTFGIFEFIQ